MSGQLEGVWKVVVVVGGSGDTNLEEVVGIAAGVLNVEFTTR